MEVDKGPSEGEPSAGSCCMPGSSSSSSSKSVDQVLQSLPCPHIWVHRGSGGRLRKAAEKTINALRQEGAVCLAAKVNTANRCISVAEIAKREIRSKGREVINKCFFAGLVVRQ
ncbi:hypothetical protein, conserved [Eimeria tenella]|uniref:DNA/RNA-binding protein Alba-like domain-containing protein n=1 Tax=Eimeria tenella TaxID=5802 RepID=U6L0R6_EIMTE|nr:hypothetical protein, conserved [Eimeria tenella]CDJ41355.1 hypothetical protein, conserved [Eimeria tenella]|eukprot:XP_013232105.1 hypothetical protein, conserved [Eimeria tenella]